MSLCREVYVMDAVFSSVHAVHTLQVGKIVFGHAVGPVAAIAHHQLRTRSSQRSDLYVVGTAAATVDIESAFAGASAIKIRGQGDDGGRCLDARIDGRDELSVAATARSAGDGDAGSVGIWPSEQVIEDANAAQCLNGHGEAPAVVFDLELQQRFTPGEEIVTDGHGPHACECGAAQLTIRPVALLLPVPVGIEDNRNSALVLRRTIEGSVDPQSRQDFDGEVFNSVSIVTPDGGGDDGTCRSFGEDGQTKGFSEAGNKCGLALLPSIQILIQTCDAVHLRPTFGYAPPVVFVGTDLILAFLLLFGFELKGPEDVIQGFIRTQAIFPLGIGDHFPGYQAIGIFQGQLISFRDIIEHILQRKFVTGIGTGLRLEAGHAGDAQASKKHPKT